MDEPHTRPGSGSDYGLGLARDGGGHGVGTLRVLRLLLCLHLGLASSRRDVGEHSRVSLPGRMGPGA